LLGIITPLAVGNQASLTRYSHIQLGVLYGFTFPQG